MDLIGFGIYSLTEIPIGAVPDVTNNQVQIITTSRNLATKDVEKFLTYPVELEMAIALVLIFILLYFAFNSVKEALIILCLVVAIVDGILAIYVGSSGGEIRHSEIRSDVDMIPLENNDDD